MPTKKENNCSPKIKNKTPEECLKECEELKYHIDKFTEEGLTVTEIMNKIREENEADN